MLLALLAASADAQATGDFTVTTREGGSISLSPHNLAGRQAPPEVHGADTTLQWHIAGPIY